MKRPLENQMRQAAPVRQAAARRRRVEEDAARMAEKAKGPVREVKGGSAARR